tara:strand:- start:905 stop:1141 length:237 start_codon:yes stop_codon:yes gene_type:complete
MKTIYKEFLEQLREKYNLNEDMTMKDAEKIMNKSDYQLFAHIHTYPNGQASKKETPLHLQHLSNNALEGLKKIFNGRL